MQRQTDWWMIQPLAKPQNAIYQLVNTYKNRRGKKYLKLFILTSRITYSQITCSIFPATYPTPRADASKALHGASGCFYQHTKCWLPKAINSNISDLNEAAKIKLFQRLLSFNKTSFSQLLNLLWLAIYLGCWNDQGSASSRWECSDFDSSKQHCPQGSNWLADGS